MVLTEGLQWEKITDMNGTRTNISNSSVILNYQICVIGGWNGGKGALRNVEKYDPQTNIWTNMKWVILIILKSYIIDQ